jgi:hypothetical protein
MMIIIIIITSLEKKYNIGHREKFHVFYLEFHVFCKMLLSVFFASKTCFLQCEFHVFCNMLLNFFLSAKHVLRCKKHEIRTAKHVLPWG